MKIILPLLALILSTTNNTAVAKLTQKDITNIQTQVISQLTPLLLAMDMDKQYIEYLKNRPFIVDGIMPDAITIGFMGRCQYLIGGCLAEQINISKNKGKWQISAYTVMGVQAGFTEMLKYEIYIAACYGSCIGVNAEGLFIGLDGMFAYGVGGGMFVDIGVDVSDMFVPPFVYTVSDLWKFRTVYAGWGLDIGQGNGFSLGAYYYLHNQTEKQKTDDEIKNDISNFIKY